jgi:hypothetical protein
MPNDIQTVLLALRDIGQAVVNIQKEVQETRKEVAEIKKGLFGPGFVPMNTPGGCLGALHEGIGDLADLVSVPSAPALRG